MPQKTVALLNQFSEDVKGKKPVEQAAKVILETLKESTFHCSSIDLSNLQNYILPIAAISNGMITGALNLLIKRRKLVVFFTGDEQIRVFLSAKGVKSRLPK
jgi:hypothetical protein